MAESSTASEASTAEQDLSLQDLKKTFDTEVSDKGVKKSAWKMTMETFGMAEGSSNDKDTMTTDLEEALAKLKEKIPEEDEGQWKFPVTPFSELDVTLDDVLRSFCIWSNKVDDDDEKGEPIYNVDKAFRRLEAYASWMYEHREDLTDPLTPESVLKAAQAWDMKITHSEKTGQLMWWFDMSTMDLKAIKEEVPVKDSLRVFVWLSHVIFLDPQAQTKGMVFVEGMGKMGMWESMTVVPMQLGTQLDRLTIGSLPLKMKAMYLFQGARWIHLLMAFMKPFMSQKMRSRMIVVPDAENPQTLLDEKFGRECIPKDFMGLVGGTYKDIVVGKYFKGLIEDPNDESQI